LENYDSNFPNLSGEKDEIKRKKNILNTDLSLYRQT